MYSATMEDPEIFERPWTINLPIYRRLEEGYEPQFKCVEFVEELMYGQYRKGGELSSAASGKCWKKLRGIDPDPVLAKCPA